MSPTRKPKTKDTRITLPIAIHEAAQTKAAPVSLRAYIAALVARDVGMTKAYRLPIRGGNRYQKP